MNQKYVDQLFEFLRIPSISALPEHKGDIETAADFLKKMLDEIGFRDISFKSAKGYERQAPIVFAQRSDDPKNSTILLYGHYDVQPVDPIREWKTKPFEPQMINGNIVGRGSGDDKGQIMTHLFALLELSKLWGKKWPVNIKVIFEGQEESGGENIDAWLKEKETKQLLQADVCILSDTGFATAITPAITYGLRGISYFQLNVRTSDFDLHSGHFGGGIVNPANALAYIITKLHDLETGKILIEGFYDEVVDLNEQERKELARVPFDERDFLRDAGNATHVHGETGYSTKERISARPTLDINGMWSGFTGEGAKTIIPSSAHVKFSTRLVPNQNPEKIAALVQKYVKKIAPKGVTITVDVIHTGNGVLVDLSSEWVQLAAKSLEETFGVQPVFDRTGGSIPLVAAVKKYLGMDAVMFGYTLPDDNFHAPNEKFSLKQFELGIRCNKIFYQKAGEMKK